MENVSVQKCLVSEYTVQCRCRCRAILIIIYVLTLPICCGVISALEADTFFANCPASSCTSGMFEVIPEKERKENREKRKREKERREGDVNGEIDGRINHR